MSSNLIARETRASLLAPAFLREPSKHIELRSWGQGVFVFLSLIPAAISIDYGTASVEGHAAQNIKDRPARKAPSH
jgi:hypothetical protein